MHQRRVIKIFRRFKNRQSAAEMMNGQFFVIVFQGKQTANALNIAEHEKVRSSARFLRSSSSSCFAFVKFVFLQINFRQNETRHIGNLAFADSLANLNRFLALFSSLRRDFPAPETIAPDFARLEFHTILFCVLRQARRRVRAVSALRPIRRAEVSVRRANPKFPRRERDLPQSPVPARA